MLCIWLKCGIATGLPKRISVPLHWVVARTKHWLIWITMTKRKIITEIIEDTITIIVTSTHKFVT